MKYAGRLKQSITILNKNPPIQDMTQMDGIYLNTGRST
jgi:hypothetical protein